MFFNHFSDIRKAWVEVNDQGENCFFSLVLTERRSSLGTDLTLSNWRSTLVDL